jgi:micrococcal nuclease
MLKSSVAMVYSAFVNKCPNADAFKRPEEIAKSKNLGVWGDSSSTPLGNGESNKNKGS